MYPNISGSWLRPYLDESPLGRQPRHKSAKLSRLEKEVDRLKSEKCELLLQLRLHREENNKLVPFLKQIKHILEERKHLQTLVSETKSKSNDLDNKISTLSAELIKTQKQSKKQEQSLKDLAQLEDKLHKVTLSYNNALSDNWTLRTDVETLLRDRQHWNRTFVGLKKSLQESKTRSAHLILKANKHYQNRDAALSSLREVRRDLRESDRQRTDEMRQWARERESKRHLDTFLKVKAHRRVDTRDLKTIKPRTDQNDKMQIKTEDNEEIVPAKVTAKNIASYKQSLDRLMKAFQDEEGKKVDLPEMVSLLVKREEANRTLFAYACDAGTEVERLTAMVEDAQEGLNNLKVKAQNGDQEMSRILQEKQKHLQELVVEYQSLEEQRTASAEELEILIEGTERLVQLTSVDSDSVDVKGKVTESNILQCLRKIEEWVAAIATVIDAKAELEKITQVQSKPRKRKETIQEKALSFETSR